jgi:demethylmenaquinone methyltransferase/2-methoxy-6-polyprenyl-1,4-benzoquinol methylase
VTRRSRQALPQGPEKVAAIRSMFDAIAPRYDLVNRVMTFGLDIRWRRRAVRALGLPPGSLIVDIACGTGDFCRELQRAGYRAVGADISAGMLAAATTSAPLIQGDALRMPLRPGRIDGITCGFALRNVVDLRALFAEFARMLPPGGRFAAVEVAEPDTPILRSGHRLYFTRVVPIIGGLLSNKEAYRYLPQSTAYLPDRSVLLAVIERAGFLDVESSPVGLGAAQIITGTRC